MALLSLALALLLLSCSLGQFFPLESQGRFFAPLLFPSARPHQGRSAPPSAPRGAARAPVSSLARANESRDGREGEQRGLLKVVDQALAAAAFFVFVFLTPSLSPQSPPLWKTKTGARVAVGARRSTARPRVAPIVAASAPAYVPDMDKRVRRQMQEEKKSPLVVVAAARSRKKSGSALSRALSSRATRSLHPDRALSRPIPGPSRRALSKGATLRVHRARARARPQQCTSEKLEREKKRAAPFRLDVVSFVRPPRRRKKKTSSASPSFSFSTSSHHLTEHHEPPPARRRLPARRVPRLRLRLPLRAPEVSLRGFFFFLSLFVSAGKRTAFFSFFSSSFPFRPLPSCAHIFLPPLSPLPFGLIA